MKQFLASLLLVTTLSLGMATLVQTSPAVASPASEARKGLNTTSSGGEVKLTGKNNAFQRIVNILLFIVGSVAVIMLVIGGVRYTISGGDSNQISAAKNTILYSLIGVVVAILAYAAVDFIIDAF